MVSCLLFVTLVKTGRNNTLSLCDILYRRLRNTLTYLLTYNDVGFIS